MGSPVAYRQGFKSISILNLLSKLKITKARTRPYLIINLKE